MAVPALAAVLLAVLALALALVAAWLWADRRKRIAEASANSSAMQAFATHLREGDVRGALRAVGVKSPSAVSQWGALDEDGTPSVLPADEADAAAAIDPQSAFGRGAREVELALGERERRWQARMRLSADWHWETGPDLRITWVSQDLASLVKLGVQPADLVGHKLHEVPLFEPPAGGWAPVLERVAKRRSVRDLTLEVHRRNRTSVWVVLNGRAHHDRQGRFVGYEGIGRDVTEQRLAHERLAESERRHTMMADLAADWFWQTDAEHRLVELGPVARQLIGERADSAIGRPRWQAFADGASDAEWGTHRADLDARREFRNFEFAVRGANRKLRWVSISGVPRVDAEGHFLGYHGVGRDITLKKRAERMLLNRNEQLENLVALRTAELEQTNRDLEAFARQLAHELRTPIGQVSSLVELLEHSAEQRLTGKEHEWLRLSVQATRDMSLTVTALLELARSQSIALLREAVDLSALAHAVIAELPRVDRRAPVQWIVAPGLAAHCSASLARVVLVNLLGNAAKFTRDVEMPRIEFGTEAGGDGGEFFVQDNGAGFDADKAASLFQPFVRLHRNDQFAGTGLGLSIVRRIVERHGGGISARGEAGKGARFVFRFTAPRPPEPTASLLDALDSGRDSKV